MREGVADRRDRHLPHRGAALHRATDRAASDLRRSGRHRHREHAAAQRAARIRCSSRPPPPTCSRSSAARPSICRPCSIRWSNRQPGCARRTWRASIRQSGDHYRHCRELRLLARAFSEFVATHADSSRAGARWPGAPCSKAGPFTSPTSWPIRNTHCSEASRRVGGYRTMLGVPLLREGTADRRHHPDAHGRCGRSPTSRSSWSTTFADQAVIAIENVRLFDEVQARTRELCRGAGAADRDLGGAAASSRSSPGELEPVFQAMLANATRICEAKFGNLLLYEGECVPAAVAMHGAPPACARVTASRTRDRSRRRAIAHRPRRTDEAGDPRSPTFRRSRPTSKRDPAIGRPSRVRRRSDYARRPDAQGERADWRDRHLPPGGAAVHRQADRAGRRTSPPRPSSPSRTRACSRSCASAPTTSRIAAAADRHRRRAQGHQPLDLRPAGRCSTRWSSRRRDCARPTWPLIYRHEGRASIVRPRATASPPEFQQHMSEPSGRAGTRTRLRPRRCSKARSIHIADVLADPEYTWTEAHKAWRLPHGARRAAAARRSADRRHVTLRAPTVRPFTDKQIELVTTFADQAVIAIENVRLFDEIQDKSRQLETRASTSRSSSPI